MQRCEDKGGGGGIGTTVMWLQLICVWISEYISKNGEIWLYKWENVSLQWRNVIVQMGVFVQMGKCIIMIVLKVRYHFELVHLKSCNEVLRASSD